MAPTAKGAYVEPTPRRVRTVFGGLTVADSRRTLLVWAGDIRLPVYYFPLPDVRADLLSESDRRIAHPDLGNARCWHLEVGGRSAADAAWSFDETEPGAEAVRGHLAFNWGEMDAWFEEDDEVFVHPRDPYHRVDVLNSSRHVRVELNGVTVAESRRPRLLFETGLPPRYYLPKADLRMDLLEPTQSHTACPYKGTASYWTVRHDGVEWPDIAWSYPSPIPECPKIEDLIAFYNEHVDLIVDGELQERPQTPWSRRSG